VANPDGLANDRDLDTMLAIFNKASETRQRQRATKLRLRRDEYGIPFAGYAACRAFVTPPAGARYAAEGLTCAAG
jgi:hypothetical protein